MMAQGTSFEVGGHKPIDRRYALAATAASALPSVGTRDGDAVTYKALATATGALDNTKWSFTFDASENYWYFTGGAPLVSFVAGGDSTVSGSYVAPGIVQEITLPLSGDYAVSLSANLNNATVGDGSACSYDIGGVGATDAWALVAIVGGGTWNGLVGRPAYLHTGVLATNKIALRIKAFTGGTAIVANRLINVLPVRVHS